MSKENSKNQTNKILDIPILFYLTIIKLKNNR